MMRSASGYGRGRIKTALTMLNMAVFAPIPSARVTIATAANPGFLISCRRARRKLLIAKGNHWIDAGGAARWNKTGSGRDRRKQRGDREINCRIERVDLEQNVFQRRRCDNAEQQCDAASAKNKADGQLPGALCHHHAENSFRIRAERHSNAEFLRPLIH